MTALESHAEPKATPGKTILFVEDDLDFREVLAAGIEETTCYRVVAVANAWEALTIARILNPDLLLLDYHLPHMDGLELYECLHTTPGLEAIPTLFLTAYPFSLAIRGRKLISLQKPCIFDDLLACIQQLLSGDQSTPGTKPA